MMEQGIVQHNEDKNAEMSRICSLEMVMRYKGRGMTRGNERDRDCS